MGLLLTAVALDVGDNNGHPAARWSALAPLLQVSNSLQHTHVGRAVSTRTCSDMRLVRASAPCNVPHTVGARTWQYSATENKATCCHPSTAGALPQEACIR